jgi:hypothetical protein
MTYCTDVNNLTTNMSITLHIPDYVFFFANSDRDGYWKDMPLLLKLKMN